MNMPSLRAFALTAAFSTLSALALGPLVGCTITTDDGSTDAGTVGTGRLEVYWTIAGVKDAVGCSTAGAAYVRVDLLNAAGAKVNLGADTQTCSTLGTSFSTSFAAGTYTVQSTLVGADGVTAVSTVVSTLVTIPADGTTVQLSVDFPTSSFVRPTGTGKLEVHWTLESSTDPTTCSTHDVANARIRLFDVSGVQVDTSGELQTCTALATSFATAFNAGTYSVQVTLLSADGTIRTSTATTSTTIPADGSTARVNVDFPATSFY